MLTAAIVRLAMEGLSALRGHLCYGAPAASSSESTSPAWVPQEVEMCVHRREGEALAS